MHSGNFSRFERRWSSMCAEQETGRVVPCTAAACFLGTKVTEASRMRRMLAKIGASSARKKKKRTSGFINAGASRIQLPTNFSLPSITIVRVQSKRNASFVHCFPADWTILPVYRRRKLGHDKPREGEQTRFRTNDGTLAHGRRKKKKKR